MASKLKTIKIKDMPMIRILIINLLLCTLSFADNLLLEDFSSRTNCQWKPCKWESRKGVSCQLDQGKLVLNFGEAGKKSKGFAFYANLKDTCELGKYKYLSFKARSADTKNYSMNVYIRKEKPVGKGCSFYSIIQLTPEWQSYNLQLKSSSRSQAGKGLFVRSKSDPGASRQLESGGILKFLTFFSKDAQVVEIDDIELKSSVSKDSEEGAAIIAAIKKHEKYSPYKFQKISAKDGPLLVENGRSSFVIYVDKNSGETGKFAASQLADYIKRSSGAELKLVEKYSPGQKTIQLLIKPEIKHKEGFRTQALTPDEIIISGCDERGLLYGVYDFLEKAVGVRWFAPFEYAEIIPEKTVIKLPLWEDESFPQMIYRRFHYCSAGRGVPDPMKHRYEAADWCVKNRYNVELERLINKKDKPALREKAEEKVKNFYSKRGGCIALPTMWGHNYHYWIPPEKYFKSNPEYFCFDSSTDKWRAERAQLCATNPDLVKEIVKKAFEYFKKYPEREYFPLFQEDGSRLWCQCPKCRELYKGRDMHSYKTEHNINLANNVAAELSKVLPGKKIATYAYSVTSQPPVNVKPRDDVFVTYCLMDFSNPDKFPWSGYYGRELAMWNKLCKGNLILYTYNYLDVYYTANIPKSLVRTFRYFDLEKIKCSCQESNENWYGVSAYNYYLSARLAWNPWFKAEEFRKDYYENLYGKASEYIEKYRILEECLSNKKYWLEYGNRTLPHIPLEKQELMQQYIEKAQAMAKGNKRLNAAVEAQYHGFIYVKTFSEAVVAGSEFQKSLDTAKYQHAAECLDKLEKVIKDLAPSRLVPILALRQTKGMRRNMKENYLRINTLNSVSKDYKTLKELPVIWRFSTDIKNQGEKDKWFARDYDDSKWKKIKIGDWWSNQGLKSYLGTAWYRTDLTIPDGKHGTALYFAGVDERAWVYLDGEYIGGHHEGDVKKLWNEPFTVQLPPDIKPGKHQLTVKVHASAGKGGIWKSVSLMAKR
jgi:hypothetical protein